MYTIQKFSKSLNKYCLHLAGMDTLERAEKVLARCREEDPEGDYTIAKFSYEECWWLHGSLD